MSIALRPRKKSGAVQFRVFQQDRLKADILEKEAPAHRLPRYWEAVLAWVVYDEHLTLWQGVGMGFVTVGIVMMLASTS